MDLIEARNTVAPAAINLLGSTKYKINAPVIPTSLTTLTASAIAASASGTSYSFVVPDRMIITQMYEQVTFQCTITGSTVAGETPVQFDAIDAVAIRDCGLDSATLSLNVTMNSRQISSGDLSTHAHVLSIFGDKKYWDNEESMSCRRPDIYGGVQQTIGGTVCPNTYSTPGNNQTRFMDTHAPYQNKTYTQISRVSEFGQLAGGTVAIPSGSLPAATGPIGFNYTFTQPINLSFLRDSSGDKKAGLTNCSGNITVNRQFVSNLTDRLFSVLNLVGEGGATLTAALTVGNAKLYYSLEYYESIPYPRFSLYKYLDRQQLAISQFTSLTSGTAVDLQPVTLTNVPHAIYIWADYPTATKTRYQSDTSPFSITKLSVTIAGYQTMFATMNSTDLVSNFMLKHGSVVSLAEALGIVPDSSTSGTITGNLTTTVVPTHGTVLKITSDQLNALPNRLTLGSPLGSQMNIQLTLNTIMASNTVSQTQPVNVYVMVEYLRVVKNEDNATTVYNQLLTEQQISELRSEPIEKYAIAGSFWSDVWDGIKNVGSAILPKVIDKVAPMIGLGESSAGAVYLGSGAERYRRR